MRKRIGHERRHDAGARVCAAFGCVPLLIAACGPASQSVYEKMNAAACSGDADKFFVYVADDKLIDNVLKRTASDQAAAATALLGAEGTRTLARGVLNEWRKDVTEKGKDGDVCGWSYVGAEKIGDGERAEIRSKAGNKKYLYFGKVDGQWKLVDFQAADATTGSTVAASASAAPPPPSATPIASGPTAMDVCQQLERAGVAAGCEGGDGGAPQVQYRVPAVLERGKPAQAMVLLLPNDKAYGVMIGGAAASPLLSKAPLFTSEKARVIVFLMGDVKFPADVQAKTKAVVDAL